MRQLRTTGVLLATVVALAATACTAAKPGWTYAPAPSMTPIPSASPAARRRPPRLGAGRRPSGAVPSQSAGASAETGGGTVLDISAQNVTYDTAALSARHAVQDPLHQQRRRRCRTTSPSTRVRRPERKVFKGEIFTGPGERTYDVPALTPGLRFRLHGAPQHDRDPHRRVTAGPADPDRRAALLHGRLSPVRRRTRSRPSRRATPPPWSSTGPSSTRVAAASRPIAGSSCGRRRPTWTVRAARKVDGEIVHELEPGDGDPPASGTRSRSTSTGRAGSP